MLTQKGGLTKQQQLFFFFTPFWDATIPNTMSLKKLYSACSTQGLKHLK